MKSKKLHTNRDKIDKKNIIPVYLTNAITNVKKNDSNKDSSIQNTILAKESVDENHK